MKNSKENSKMQTLLVASRGSRFAAALVLTLLAAGVAGAAEDALDTGDSVMASLVEDFANPPREAGVRCWWWWLNSNVTKEAITRDLEAMHEKGFSGAMIFDAGTELWWGPDANPPNGPQFGGPEWTALYLHALNEANRLNLKIGLSIQSGWNLGGPSVTLDDKAKQLTASEIQVEGGETIRETLPVPQSNYGYYRDICVLAWPHKARVATRAFNLRASTEQPGHSVDNINMPGAYWVSRGTRASRGKPQWIDVQFETEKEVAQLRIRGGKATARKHAACVQWTQKRPLAILI